MERQTLTPREASRALGVSVRRVRALVRAGQLPAVSLGPRLTRIPLDSIRKLLEQRGAERHARNQKEADE